LVQKKKKVEKNELETAIVQRRSIHSAKDLFKNTIVRLDDLKFLRPCPKNGIPPYDYKKIIGKKLKRNVQKNLLITFKDLD
jgi:N-acetylneuraminate synthase